MDQPVDFIFAGCNAVGFFRIKLFGDGIMSPMCANVLVSDSGSLSTDTVLTMKYCMFFLCINDWAYFVGQMTSSKTADEISRYFLLLWMYVGYDSERSYVYHPYFQNHDHDADFMIISITYMYTYIWHEWLLLREEVYEFTQPCLDINGG